MKEAQRQELELRKRQRELEEKLELELSREIDAERQKIIQKTSKGFEETLQLKDAEKSYGKQNEQKIGVIPGSRN